MTRIARTVRPLKENDFPAWRELRIAMLRNHPGAFGKHIDEFLARDELDARQGMLDGNVHGAFVDGRLAACAGWFPVRGLKRSHIGLIWGMYVDPEYRGIGLARDLIRVLVQCIRKAGREVAQLDVAEDNATALALYESEGFEVWGREPDAMRIDGEPKVELHMWRKV